MGGSRAVLEDGRFAGRGPDLVHEPSGFRVWFVRPLGMLTQVGARAATDDEVAVFLSTTAFQELKRRRSRGEPYVFLHDWRRLESYTPGARRIMTEWGLRVRGETTEILIALAPHEKVVRMGVSVATMALQVAGFTVKVGDDLQPEIDRLGVRPAE